MMETPVSENPEFVEFTPSPAAIEVAARAIEAQICSRYEWTEEQFEIWWSKDPRNRNKDERRKQAESALRALNAAGYDISETSVPPMTPR
jgi:hypothetical protein